MKFVIRDSNQWTTFAAIVESQILHWSLDDRAILVLVSMPKVDLISIDRMKQMALSMREDVLFLEANTDENETNSINVQIKTLNNWIDLLNSYQAWK